MLKVFLEIDMPESCMACGFNVVSIYDDADINDDNDVELTCLLIQDCDVGVSDEIYDSKRHELCPLIEM